jgi:predicted XRE-type DNA-binding protein
MVAKGRSPIGARNGHAKLNDTLVAEIRTRYEQHRTPQAALAREYGVSQARICDVINRKTWRHVP